MKKKDRDKRVIKKWRSITLLNKDLKLISKALETQLKEILSDFISFNQTVYAKKDK